MLGFTRGGRVVGNVVFIVIACCINTMLAMANDGTLVGVHCSLPRRYAWYSLTHWEVDFK